VSEVKYQIFKTRNAENSATSKMYMLSENVYSISFLVTYMYVYM